MPKTSMATLKTCFSFGIILFLLLHSVCAEVPDDLSKSRQGSDENNAGRKSVSNSVKEHLAEQDERETNEQTQGQEGQRDRSAKVEDSEGKDSDSSDKDVEGRVKPPRSNDKLSEGKVKNLGGDQSPCAEDVDRLCHEIPKGKNFEILSCLQDKAKEDDLSPECHHMLWEYKRSVTQNPKFEYAAENFCKDDLEHLKECAGLPKREGKLIPCLLEHRQNISTPRCKHMMTKMQVMVFSDFRLIEGFLRDCTDDVKTYHCGRLPTDDEDEEDVHSQNDVLECLEEHQEKLKPECQKQIYRLAELSSDDFHLDRPLYYACLDDREKFCAEVPSGEGRVYKCLKKHKFEETMSEECRQKLTERQRVEARDARANYPLMKHCIKFYHQYKKQFECETSGTTRHGTLASILTCLEKAIENDQRVSGECQSELLDLKQQLMADYSINPEIVAKCDMEIENHCQRGALREGKTLDCLMKLAEENEEEEKETMMRPQCFDAVKDLLSETGAGSDYRIDHTLYMACEPVVQTVCKDKGKKAGDVMVLSCLMENMHTDNMNPECEEQLLHLEFFLSRDFSLDQVLEKACRQDVENICHSTKVDDENGVPPSMILSCLYRNSLADSSKVSQKCAAHVRRVMHQRAIDVHLLPEVQIACIKDLGEHCNEKVDKGEEIECLQENFDKLGKKCKMAIGNFTEEEGEDYQLDRVLVKACSGMLSKFCEDVVSRGETEEVLPCLVEHKNDPDMDEKCHAAVEHWQLIESKDFRFSPEMRRACRRDAENYCNTAQSKNELLVCLSTHIRDAVLDETEHVISEQCRKQLRIEQKVEGENLLLAPIILAACITDVSQFCKHVPYGQAKVFECLRQNQDDLSEKCREMLLAREKEEMKDPEIDYKLRKSCRKMIRLFCDDVPPSDVFYCLKRHKNHEDMEPNCREIIIKRQIRQSHDVRLDPQLGKYCKLDIPKFCGTVEKGEGRILQCLKKHRESLSEECEDYIGKVIVDAAHDYRLDARLVKQCKKEINDFCSNEEPSGVEECLRSHLGSLKTQDCRLEVVRFMKEGRTDIQADPLLYKACALDVKRHCPDIPFGRGQVVKCLLEARESDRGRMTKECLFHLNSRMKMWQRAPETMNDLAAVITMSPSKNYFFIVFATCLALIFVGGLVFGRLSKRIRREVKDR